MDLTSTFLLTKCMQLTALGKNIHISFYLVSFHMYVSIQPRISSLACVPLYKIQCLPQRIYTVLQ